MKRSGVIGYPLTHSLSPTIFQAAFDAAGLEAGYEAWATGEDQLEGRVNSLRGDNIYGANVTIPYKEAVIPMLDRVDEAAEAIGAVNTIVHDGGDLIGYNTDLGGFNRSLKEDAGFDPKGRHTAILGAGGAARAVAHALVGAGATTVLVAGRKPAKLEGIVSGLRPKTGPGVTISWCYWNDGAYLKSMPEAELLVNCTPIGTLGGDDAGESPIELADMYEGGVVFDLVYNPQKTPLLRQAAAKNSNAVSGLGMLVYQAAESFKLWTGPDAHTSAMLEAGRKVLADG
jgi:shikimate dehydrogenase